MAKRRRLPAKIDQDYLEKTDWGGSLGLFGQHSRRNESRDRRLFDEAVAESSSVVQVLVRADDLFPVYISPSFERVFGVDPERMEDDTETLFRFLDDAERLRIQRFMRGWDRKSPLVFDCRYENDRALRAPMRLRTTVAATLGGEYLLVTYVDVTDEHAKMDDLVAERDRALDSAAERTDFMNQMSHEIRTPLNGIEGMISLAREHRADESRLLDDLGRASQLSSYLLSLVNDVLDMSRLNSGRVKLEELPFDLRLLAAELERMFAGQAADKGLAYQVELEDCENVYLVGDRMRLSQVVINFISNALKFTDRGGQVNVVFREMYRADAEVSYMLRVRDTGKGMDPRYISRIFKPFEQEDRTIARRYGGTGLGMAITSSLVDLMGGELVVDTEPGKGSTFSAYVTLRVATADEIARLERDGQTLETSADAADPALSYDFSGKRFLLVEDNEINAMIAAELLEKQGVSVDRAENGLVAIERFESLPSGTYDAILMDIQMPVLGGWEAAERIRALDHSDARSVPIIALSANDYAEDVERSRAAGMNGHVGKPIDFFELKAQLAAATAESAYRGSN